MRVIEPWVAAPLQGFLDESGARLTLLMTSAGQVIAQDGFTRSVDVMAAAALGAAIMASTDAIAEVMSTAQFGVVLHQGPKQSLVLRGVLDAARTLDRAGGLRVGNVGRAGPALLPGAGGGAGEGGADGTALAGGAGGKLRA